MRPPAPTPSLLIVALASLALHAPAAGQRAPSPSADPPTVERSAPAEDPAPGPVRPGTAPAAGSAAADSLAADPVHRSDRGFPLAAEAELIGRASLHAISAPARWGPREWALAGGSIAAVAVASVADEDGRSLMAYVRNERNTRVEEMIEPFGAEGSLYLLGGLLATGALLDDAKLRGTAAEGLAAGLVAAGLVTPTLQKVIGRAKPRDGMPAHTYDAFGGDRSLPSGHTTQAFAVASVIAAEYDHPLVQAGAYGLATAVGVSRMYRRSHFLSDVVGAAIIGTVVGRTVARFGMEWRAGLEGMEGPERTDGPEGMDAPERAGGVSLRPTIGAGGVGVMVSGRF